MTSKNTITKLSPKAVEEVQWKAGFQLDITAATRKWYGYYSSFGYVWGASAENPQAKNEWVVRCDIDSRMEANKFYDFENNWPFTFRPLLVEGGGAMLAGGPAVKGTLHILQLDRDLGIFEAELINVTAQGGRPDGTEMDAVHASRIHIKSPVA